jgi:hypothetical protein
MKKNWIKRATEAQRRQSWESIFRERVEYINMGVRLLEDWWCDLWEETARIETRQAHVIMLSQVHHCMF